MLAAAEEEELSAGWKRVAHSMEECLAATEGLNGDERGAAKDEAAGGAVRFWERTAVAMAEPMSLAAQLQLRHLKTHPTNPCLVVSRSCCPPPWPISCAVRSPEDYVMQGD